MTSFLPLQSKLIVRVSFGHLFVTRMWLPSAFHVWNSKFSMRFNAVCMTNFLLLDCQDKN